MEVEAYFRCTFWPIVCSAWSRPPRTSAAQSTDAAFRPHRRGVGKRRRSGTTSKEDANVTWGAASDTNRRAINRVAEAFLANGVPNHNHRRRRWNGKSFE